MFHVALNVEDVERARAFYVDVIGMKVEWQPDTDNVYLTSGRDNLAIHRSKEKVVEGKLGHLGFVLPRPEDVDAWADHMKEHGVALETAPRTHRDGARSFYARDPEGTLLQFIHHPPISSGKKG
jgi:catechol 2,3-dioxygenase-like lactoylglutathione lyase family enzyme